MSVESQQSGESRKQTDDFSKSIEFVKADEEKQIAYGAVLVPNRVDFQGDFLRPETIESLAENYEARVAEGDALPGVMHAVFPREHIELVEDRLLDGEETIGEKTLPDGTWVQGYRFVDDELWSLVKDGVLGGNSIGGTIEEEIWYSPGAVPDDVEFPDAVVDQLAEYDLSPDEAEVREIGGGRIMEVSAVDFPAVPDATHAAHKSVGLWRASKKFGESVVDDRIRLEERGHSEEDARRLAEYMDRTKSKSLVERARRRIWPNGHRESGDNEKHSTETGPAESGEDADEVSDLLKTMDQEELSDTLNDIKAQNETLTERVDSLSEKVDDEPDEPNEEKSDTATEEQIEELTAALKTLGENQEQILGRVERMSEAGGFSQQKSDENPGGDEPSNLSKTLGLGNMAGGD